VTVVIEPGGLLDLPEIEALRRLIGWDEAGWLIRPLRHEQGLVLCARDGGALTGAGMAALFGTIGFIGNMTVAPERQGQGIGREIFGLLMDWFAEHGAERVELEATAAGRPLYEKFGFTGRWETQLARFRGSPRGERAGDGVRPLAEGDWPAAGTLDARAYGGDRTSYLQRLAGDGQTETLALERDARLRGFGMARPGRIGPLVAESPDDARVLASALSRTASQGLPRRLPFARPLARVLGRPPRHGATRVSLGGAPEAVAVWKAAGYDVRPFNLRMTWGAAPQDRPELTYALVAAAVG
jgi:GNAT superfamily N-acetyltransferase